MYISSFEKLPVLFGYSCSPKTEYNNEPYNLTIELQIRLLTYIICFRPSVLEVRSNYVLSLDVLKCTDKPETRI